MKRLPVFVTLPLLLALALTGCTLPAPAPSLDTVSSETASGDKPLPVVRYVNFRVVDPVYIAIDKGFFVRRGVEVQIVGDVLAGPTAIQAVAAGSAEAGLTSVPALINANAAGLPVQGVADIQTTLAGQPLQRWYVAADSPYRTLADVAGARYAVNLWKSSFHYTSLRAMRDAGVDPAAVTFQLLSFPDQITALIGGEVDVIGLIPPYQGYLEAMHGGEVRELWNDYAYYGSKHVSLIFVNRVWAQHNPQTARAFALGIADAVEWIEANQQEAAAIVGSYTGIDPAHVGDYHFTPRAQVRLEDVAWWLDWMGETGEIEAHWLTPEDVATNSYLGGGAP